MLPAWGESSVTKRHSAPAAGSAACQLDSQTLAALGAACVDHGAATASLHADQETMGTCATDFGRLVSAFHVNFPNRLSWDPCLRKSTNVGLLAPNTIRGTRHYRKLYESRQHLRPHTACSTVRFAFVSANVDKVLINYNPARSKL